MLVAIKHDVIGSSHDLYYDSKLDNFVNLQNGDDHKDLWTFTQSHDRNVSFCLNDLFDIYDKSTSIEPPSQFKTALKALGCSSNRFINWRYVLPWQLFETYSLSMARDIVGHFQQCDKDYYIETFRDTVDVLRALEPAAINSALLSQYLISEPNKSVKTTLVSFEPDNAGFAKKVVYGRFKSRTGRLVVQDGPRILLLKKDYKNILKSHYVDGKVLQFDYISFEARVALAIAQKNIHNDIYEELNVELLDNKFTRDVAKSVILSVLYGMSVDKVSALTNTSQNQAKKIIKVIKQYFDFDNIVKQLKEYYKKTGEIKNYYGRPVKINNYSPGGLYNSYIQSTGVDMALLGFKPIIDMGRKMNLRMRPLFVQHDALIVDIAPELYKHIENIKSAGENISDIQGSFPLSSSVIS